MSFLCFKPDIFFVFVSLQRGWIFVIASNKTECPRPSNAKTAISTPSLFLDQTEQVVCERNDQVYAVQSNVA